MCLCCKTELQKSLTNQEREECTRDFIKSSEYFPNMIFLICTTINILCGYNAFLFQIVSIIFKSPLYYIGAGSDFIF